LIIRGLAMSAHKLVSG